MSLWTLKFWNALLNEVGLASLPLHHKTFSTFGLQKDSGSGLRRILME